MLDVFILVHFLYLVNAMLHYHVMKTTRRFRTGYHDFSRKTPTKREECSDFPKLPKCSVKDFPRKTPTKREECSDFPKTPEMFSKKKKTPEMFSKKKKRKGGKEERKGGKERRKGGKGKRKKERENIQIV